MISQMLWNWLDQAHELTGYLRDVDASFECFGYPNYQSGAWNVYVDLMLLHLVPLKSFTWDIGGKKVAVGDLESRAGALQAFVDAKEKGEIRAVGLSTHSALVLEKALEMPEIEVVCTTFNKVGSFVEDGSQEAHLEAIKSAKAAGKGVYVVKVMNAGKLRDEADSAIRYALQFHEFIDAWNIGMYDKDDVNQNVKLFKEVLG